MTVFGSEGTDDLRGPVPEAVPGPKGPHGVRAAVPDGPSPAVRPLGSVLGSVRFRRAQMDILGMMMTVTIVQCRPRLFALSPSSSSSTTSGTRVVLPGNLLKKESGGKCFHRKVKVFDQVGFCVRSVAPCPEADLSPAVPQNAASWTATRQLAASRRCAANDSKTEENKYSGENKKIFLDNR